MLTSLKNHFLIAMPSLMDPIFFQSVTYLCEHTENGAIGIMINQPLSSLRLGEVLEEIGIKTEYPEIASQVVFSGGPVQPDKGFILHSNEATFASTLRITPTISLTTSPDILEAIAKNKGPSNALVALGFSSWDNGQLEKELLENSWLHGPSNFDILFHMAIGSRWRAAATSMGVDVDRLSNDVGHA